MQVNCYPQIKKYFTDSKMCSPVALCENRRNLWILPDGTLWIRAYSCQFVGTRREKNFRPRIARIGTNYRLKTLSVAYLLRGRFQVLVEPGEGVGLHGAVEFVAAGVEIAADRKSVV